MTLLLYGLCAWTLLTAILAFAIHGVRRACGARPRWRRVLWAVLAAIPLHAFLSVPATLGFLGTRLVRTRHDEAAYRGPQVTPAGEWVVQTRATLADSARPGANGEAAPAHRIELQASDGVALRAFFVPAPAARQPIDAVLVHGLFRGGLEIETVGRWLRDLGCDVLLLELRNHGGSQRAPASFGPREALDVRAAAAWLAKRDGAASRQLLLFGVSLGTVAVALAAPEVERLRWIALDAPVIDLAATARRMLAIGPRRLKGRFGLPEPFCSLTVWFLELFTGVRLAAIRPLESLRRLPPHVRGLVIGGGDDDRVAITDIEATWRALPAPTADKALWVAPNADHGLVWERAPEEYRTRLRELLQR